MDFYYIYFLYALLAFAITYFLVPFVIKISFKIGALDVPEERRIHRKPTANIGGVAIYLGFVITAILSLELSKEVLGILIGGTLMMVVGFLDGIIGLRAIPKLIAQITGALILVAFGVQINLISNPTEGVFELGHFAIPLTILWVVGMTNVINFIDGMDGLAGGVVSISAGVLAVASFLTGRPEVLPLAIYLCAVNLAFLRCNFHPAKVFMGDSGAYFLGFTIAALSIQGTLKSAAFLSLLVPILAVGVPILDTALVMLKRWKNKKPLMKADKGHIHHFFLDLGYDQKKSVLIIYGLNLIFGLLAIISTQISKYQTLVLFALAFLFMISIRNGKFKK